MGIFIRCLRANGKSIQAEKSDKAKFDIAKLEATTMEKVLLMFPNK